VGVLGRQRSKYLRSAESRLQDGRPLCVLVQEVALRRAPPNHKRAVDLPPSRQGSPPLPKFIHDVAYHRLQLRMGLPVEQEAQPAAWRPEERTPGPNGPPRCPLSHGEQAEGEDYGRQPWHEAGWYSQEPFQMPLQSDVLDDSHTPVDLLVRLEPAFKRVAILKSCPRGRGASAGGRGTLQHGPHSCREGSGVRRRNKGSL